MELLIRKNKFLEVIYLSIKDIWLQRKSDKFLIFMRKTVNDYQQELHRLKLAEIALNKHIRARAEEMCIANPDVMIGNVDIITYSKDYIGKINNVDMNSVFIIMEAIEEDLKAKHPHKQTTIQFPKTQHEKLMDIAKGIKDLNIPESKK